MIDLATVRRSLPDQRYLTGRAGERAEISGGATGGGTSVVGPVDPDDPDDSVVLGASTPEAMLGEGLSVGESAPTSGTAIATAATARSAPTPPATKPIRRCDGPASLDAATLTSAGPSLDGGDGGSPPPRRSATWSSSGLAEGGKDTPESSGLPESHLSLGMGEIGRGAPDIGMEPSDRESASATTTSDEVGTPNARAHESTAQRAFCSERPRFVSDRLAKIQSRPELGRLTSLRRSLATPFSAALTSKAISTTRYRPHVSCRSPRPARLVGQLRAESFEEPLELRRGRLVKFACAHRIPSVRSDRGPNRQRRRKIPRG
jgi:hypothetical protein